VLRNPTSRVLFRPWRHGTHPRLGRSASRGVRPCGSLPLTRAENGRMPAWVTLTHGCRVRCSSVQSTLHEVRSTLTDRHKGCL